MTGEETFRRLTWDHVERLGIPPSPVRDAFFALAGYLDSHPKGGLLALASGAYRSLEKELAEFYRPRSPLELQVETLRAERELAAMLNTEFSPVKFAATDFEPTPQTPTDLGESLGYNDRGRAVRRLLRRGFPEHEKGALWSPLTPSQINYVKAHLASRR